MWRLGLIAATLLAFAATTVAASPKDVEIKLVRDSVLVIPASSTLRPIHVETERDPSFEFKGQFVVSGTYHFTRQRARGRDTPGWTIFFLDVDKGSMDALPHLKFRDGTREYVEQLRFDNENDFLKAVLSAETLRTVKKAKQFSVSGHVTILADHLSFGDDCGYLWTTAHFVSVQNTAVASNKNASYGC